MKFDLSLVPAALKNLDRWVCWRREDRDGKSTKVPYQPNGRRASSTDPATWSSFSDCAAALSEKAFAGVGFVMVETDGFVAWDLDHVVDSVSESVDPWAQAIVGQLDGYTEISPSGTGLRILLLGTLPADGRKIGPVEMYRSKRYVTITGRALRHGGEEAVPEREEVNARTFREQVAVGEVLKRIGKDSPLRLLFDGEWTGTYPSQSEADLAFCARIAPMAGGDPRIVDLVFRRSKLIRTKWDEKHGEATYGEMTVAKAVAGGQRSGEPVEQQGDPEPQPRRVSVAVELIRIGEASAELFHDERESSYAAIQTGVARRIVPISSGIFSKFLAGRFYEETGKAASGEALRSARAVLGHKALRAARHPLHNRFAFLECDAWIDLCDAKRRAVRVTRHGWKIERSPILFKEFRGQAPLPDPISGGVTRVTPILDFLNVRDEGDRILFLVWLVTAPLAHIPRPILIPHGPQGAAKTTAAKMSRRLTDSSSSPTNFLSSRDDELALTLETNAVPIFDNVTRISPRQADILCQAVTGGGFSKRELYTDADEVFFEFQRAMIVTGINVPTTAPDLLDRSLLIELARVPPRERRSESSLWAAFESAAPGIFGGLLDTLSEAMRIYPTIELESSQRMADWTLWGAAVAEALGFGRRAFLDAYRANLGKQTEEVLEADPVGRAVRELTASDGGFEGTATGLLRLFKDKYPDEAKTDGWPKRADGLSKRLGVLQATLSDVGIEVTRVRQAGTGERRIRIRPSTIGPNASRASFASQSMSGSESEAQGTKVEDAETDVDEEVVL